jgi:hypothetical protein
MNNLLIVMLAGTLGFALYCKTLAASSDTAGSSADDRAKLERAAAEAANGRAEVRRLENLFVTQREKNQTLRGDLNVLSAQEAAKAEDLSDLNPQKEGFWPADKPYFYIAKERLRGLSYWPFTDNEDRLSKQAALLFALTPEEESAANTAYIEMREKIRQLEKASAIATNTPANVADSPGSKMTFVVPPIPRESIDAVNGEFKARLAGAIGPERAGVLARRIDETFEMSPYGVTKPRTLTLVRNGDKIQLVETDGDSFTRSSTTDDDGKQIVPRHVRHLFSQ